MMPTKYLPLATWTLAGVGTSLTLIKPVRRNSHSRPRPSSLVVLFASSSSNESPKQQHRRRWEEEAAAGVVKKGDDDDDDDDDEECALPLLPLTNPNFDMKAKSLSGVLYARVISGINALYPPHELSNRNARSRTDGYWKYVARGERPPQEFTYGEFDVDFFGMLLDKSWEHHVGGMMMSDDDRDDDEKQQHSTGLLLTTTPWRNKTFCDIGSGDSYSVPPHFIRSSNFVVDSRYWMVCIPCLHRSRIVAVWTATSTRRDGGLDSLVVVIRIIAFFVFLSARAMHYLAQHHHLIDVVRIIFHWHRSTSLADHSRTRTSTSEISTVPSSSPAA